MYRHRVENMRHGDQFDQILHDYNDQLTELNDHWENEAFFQSPSKYLSAIAAIAFGSTTSAPALAQPSRFSRFVRWFQKRFLCGT